MKNTVLILWLALLWSCSNKPKEGFLKFYSDTDIEKLYIYTKPAYPISNKFTYVNKEKVGFPNIIINTKTPQGDKKITSTNFYIKNDGVLEVNFKDGNMSFSGDYKKENDFYQEIHKILNYYTEPKNIYSKSESEFLSYLKKIENETRRLINANSKSVLDKDFLYLVENDIKYSLALYKLNYPKYHKHFLGDKANKVSDTIHNFIGKFKLEDEKLTPLNSYIKFLCSVNDIPSKDYNITTTFENIDNIKNDKIKSKIKIDYLYKFMSYYGISNEIQKLYDEIIANVDKFSDFDLKSLKARHKELLAISKGADAPNFTAYDINDKEVKLSDFKGNLVYVDIWATWCGPCKREIPHLKKLQKEYKDNKNLVFMQVSVDDYKDKDNWKDMLKNKGLEGIQLIAKGNFSSEIAKKYKVTAIPMFLLIDKEGKIISSRAPKPSSGNEIRELINKNI